MLFFVFGGSYYYFSLLVEIISNLIILWLILRYLYLEVEIKGILEFLFVRMKCKFFHDLKIILPYMFCFFAFVISCYILNLRINNLSVFVNEFFISEPSIYYIGLLFLNITILVPIKEEIIIRKLVYNGLKEKFNVMFSSLISSLIFSLLHGDVLSSFFYSIIANHLYEGKKRLSVNIFLHSSINFLILLFYFLEIGDNLFKAYHP